MGPSNLHPLLTTAPPAARVSARAGRQAARGACLVLWLLAAAGCTGLERLSYELQPSSSGETLSVSIRLAFRQPPPTLSLVGRASSEIVGLHAARATDAEGRPVPVEVAVRAHAIGQRVVQLPELVIQPPVPREIEIRYWLRPGVRDGNEHVGFKGHAFGDGQPGMVFVSARNVLLMPDLPLEHAAVEVRAALPAGWSAAAQWLGTGGRFTPGPRGRHRIEDLVSSPIALGRLVETDLRIGDTDYAVWMPASVADRERGEALRLMERLARSVHATMGFSLGERYTVIAMSRSGDGEEIRGDAWGTGQGGTLLPMTPARARAFTRRLLEAHVRHLPYRRALEESADYWVLDAIEQLVSWQIVADAGLVDEAEVREFYAAEYLSTLGLEGFDPDLARLYEREGSRRTEREILAPFMLAWLEHDLAGGAGTARRIDWRRVFQAGRLSAGLPPDTDPALWKKFRTRYLRGTEAPPAEELLAELPLEPLPVGEIPQARRVSVLFTGQTEGYLENCGCKTNQSGGIARRATVIDRARQHEERLLVLDAGSMLAHPDRQGSKDFLAEAEEQLYLRAAGRMGYDAVAVGQTELEQAHDTRAGGGALPYLSANLMSHDHPLAPPWKRIALKGVRAGIVGLFEVPRGPDDEGAFQPAITDLRAEEPVAALSRSLDAMGPVDLTVVMGRLTPRTIRKLVEARPDVDLVISTEGPTSPGEHMGPGEREVNAGRSGSAVVVMSRISKYGVGELRLDLDADGRIGAAGIRTTMLDETVPDHPEMRRLLADFYDRMGRDARAQESVPALFPGDSVRAAGRYVGVATCAGCHGSQHEQWRSTPHASAYKTLLDVHRHYNPRCVVCHVVGYGTANGYRLGSPGEELANVQCEVCHGPGGEHASQPNRDNIRKAVDESTCLQCHTPEHSEAFVFADRLPKVVHSPERGAVAMRTGGGSR